MLAVLRILLFVLCLSCGGLGGVWQGIGTICSGVLEAVAVNPSLSQELCNYFWVGVYCTCNIIVVITTMLGVTTTFISTTIGVFLIVFIIMSPFIFASSLYVVYLLYYYAYWFLFLCALNIFSVVVQHLNRLHLHLLRMFGAFYSCYRCKMILVCFTFISVILVSVTKLYGSLHSLAMYTFGSSSSVVLAIEQCDKCVLLIYNWTSSIVITALMCIILVFICGGCVSKASTVAARELGCLKVTLILLIIKCSDQSACQHVINNMLSNRALFRGVSYKCVLAAHQCVSVGCAKRVPYSAVNELDSAMDYAVLQHNLTYIFRSMRVAGFRQGMHTCRLYVYYGYVQHLRDRYHKMIFTSSLIEESDYIYSEMLFQTHTPSSTSFMTRTGRFAIHHVSLYNSGAIVLPLFYDIRL